MPIKQDIIRKTVRLFIRIWKLCRIKWKYDNSGDVTFKNVSGFEYYFKNCVDIRG